MNELITLFIADHNQVLIAQLDGIKCVINGMNVHKNNPIVQEYGCGALWNLSLNGNVHSRHTQFILIQYINLMLIHLIQYSFSSTETHILFIYWHLITENNRIVVANEGGVGCIIATMYNHRDNAAVQENACGAMWNLAVNGILCYGYWHMTHWCKEDNRLKIAKEGGISCIIDVMTLHKDYAGLCF
jgi:hypothetical protein